MKRTAIVIFASALLIQVTGCTVGFYNATVIEPRPIKGVAKIYSSDLPCPALRLSLTDVDITVCASPSDSPIDHGTILTVFAVLEPKAADLQVDPAQLRYEVQGKSPGRPQLVKRKAPGSYITVSRPMALKERVEFNVWFRAPQEREFTVLIGGISKAGQPITVPPIESTVRNVRRALRSWTYQ